VGGDQQLAGVVGQGLWVAVVVAVQIDQQAGVGGWGEDVAAGSDDDP
jgi:hypothetical protein